MNFFPPFHPNSDCFPALDASGFRQTSPIDFRYNCIAWAASENRRWWWPLPPLAAKWPPDIPRELTLAAFVAAFATLGYERCNDGNHEIGFEKIAFYALAGEVKHAARQLEDGNWTSKLGKDADITHTLDGLEGPHYGNVVGFVRRPIILAK